ncbi:KEOPS complex subunit Pcc1 [Halorhabdus rudnickae]|uniref:KEOPS complex subunit Pcc1 n=1 Tax=Halorhabdus rudnickae TaxID=1775544 RepID=UPI001083A19D|nr:KEOPS complex subunit Pcc1 [Halorhabdus rudnickae]
MDHEAVLTFEYSDPDSARLVERSVAREIGEIGGDRTRTRIGRVDNTLTLTVEAADLIALRAGLNTWTGLVAVAEESGAVHPASEQLKDAHPPD